MSKKSAEEDYITTPISVYAVVIAELEAERDTLQDMIKQLEAELEEERQENASLRSGDNYV